MELGAPHVVAVLSDADELAEDDAEDAEQDDAQHHACGVEEDTEEADVEAEARIRRDELRAHHADQRAAGADADAAEDVRDRARDSDGSEREPPRAAEAPSDLEM